MGKTSTTNPDQSAAMISMAQTNAATQRHQSDNMYQLGMSQIGAGIMQSQGMFIMGSSQISANLELGHERNELSREIARMNYDLQGREQEDRHSEKMQELSVRKHEIDAEAKSGNQIDTSDFTV